METFASGHYEALMNSPSMRAINEVVLRVAATDVTVLIWGESGVGKEVVARTLHQRSIRCDRPFVKVNCAALPAELLESELFGHERGAFTGACQRKLGKFDQARTGTIFLDEISEMPLALQPKLLHVLQDREFSRLGSQQSVCADVRVIAATNRDLAAYVAQGGFREDLFYRLNVVTIRVPTLRERPEEIPTLVTHFLARYGQKHGREPVRISPETLDRFQQYSWPGNVRELENVIQRIVVLGTESVVEALAEIEPPPVEDRANGAGAATADDDGELDDALGLKELGRRAAELAERRALKRTLERVRWRRTEAAQRLQVSYKTLLEKIKQYELDRPGSP
ncbi:MAG TPA: sigma-54 dependent transcriptional regulator [Vicinamibacterales bacterium]|nr:sigma-54 dependent transcriptional regulator [Vicinamibacterales bacterium]